MSMVQQTIETLSPMTDLFQRIQFEHLRRKQHKRQTHFKYTFTFLLVSVSILYLFGYHVRIYNVLAGPFHVNFDHLTISLNDYSQRSSSWFSFPREYLQVEFGENQLEQEGKSTLDVSSDGLPKERLSHTFIRMKDHFYVKLAMPDNNYFPNQLPYRFQSLTEQTLRCIIQQLDITLEKYTQCTDKSMLIKVIEEIYRQNTTEFHMKVIVKCGILIGYLSQSQFGVIFDASSSYYSWEIFLLSGIIFGWLLIVAFFSLVLYVFHAIHQPVLFIHSSVKAHLNTLHLDSLEEFEDLLSRTVDENNYHNRLFLLEDQYLLLLHIDWNEHNTSILHRFYERDSSTLISIPNIVCIQNNEILSKHGDQHTWHSLPIIPSISKKRTTEWLHQKLMQVSATYQECYAELERAKKRPCSQLTKEDKLRREQQKQEHRLRRQRKKELQRRLKILLAEEEERQQTLYETDRQTIRNGIIPASPRFIAQFRLTSSEQVNQDDLSDTLCSVCHGNIEFGESYTRWPCPAKHVFHYDCILMVLRAHHTCPLCRYPVEKSDFIIQLSVSQYFYNIFI